MKKYIEHILTTAFVSMLVAILFIVVMPRIQSKANGNSEGGATGASAIQTSGSAFRPATGSAFEFVATPGNTTQVRFFTDGFDATLAEGRYQFVSFGLETSDEKIVATELSISSSSNGIYSSGSRNEYPDSNAGDKDNYPCYILYDSHAVIDFKVACSDLLPVGDHTITLYGIAMLDEGNSFNISRAAKLRSHKVPLATFVLKNTVKPKDAKLYIEAVSFDKNKLAPSSSNTFSVKVTNKGEADASEVYIVADLGSKLTPDYEMQKIRVGSLKAGETKTFKVPFTVNADATKGNSTASFTVSGVDKYGNGIDPITESIYITIGKGSTVTPTDAPSLSLATKQNYKLLVPSTDDSVIIRITNNGSRLAKNVRLSCEKGFGVGEGLTKSYTTSYIAVDDIPVGKTVKVEVPFLVGAGFGKGIHELEFSATYLDEDKHEYKSDIMTMYVEHYKTGEIAEVDGLTYLLISGVTQTPNMPQAGERVTVSFNVKNKGTEKVTNLHFYATGLSAAGFQPVTGEPYQDEGSLEAGESKKVTMTFMAGEDIPKGVNSLSIGYDYFDASNKAQQSTTTIYVLNVVNHKFDDIDVGRPKIIVSDYSTEPEILRAGETFDFSYTLKNTHTGKEARNIKITLSQADGVIAPAQGTNIFYIDKLDPTQEVVLSLPLKSRADTVTGDYAVVLKLEYEYDDMSEVDKEHGGVSEENTLKIRVIENYRPVIENIFIDAYQGIVVGQPVDLSFEFYNMGKSTLGNVYITIEGDFALANNSAMSYVGAVQGYGQEYLSPQIVPLVGGEAHGTVTIHFEDSNGDEQTKSSDFQAWVEDPMGGGDFGGDWNMNFGNVSGGYYDWGGEFPEGMDFGEGFPGMEGEGEDEGFFASIPWWVWVIVGVVVVGGTVVIIVVVKKRKAKKEADEEDNEDI